MSGAGARLVAWQRRHALSTTGALLLLAGFFGWAGYRGYWHFKARSHFRAAQLAVDRHDWKDALARLQTSLHDGPNDAETHLLAARVARRLERLDEADRHLETCQRLQGGETRATKVERSLLRVYRGGLADEEAFLRGCVQVDDPAAPEILDVLSAALIVDYRIAEAQRCLDDLLQRRPDDFDALVRRGWTARNMGWYADAVLFYEKALALRPDVDAVRLAMAEILVALARFADAQSHFERLRDNQPDNPSVQFGLARCLAGNNQKEQAVQLLDRLLDASPNDWKMLSERGGLAVQLDRPAEGEPYLRRAVALAPPDLQLLVRFADCLRLVGKQDEAAQYRDKADRLKADIQRAAELGDWIRERSPNDADLRYELGCTLLRLGKKPDALHWFKTALDKEPAHRKTHEALVEFYTSVGDYGQADEHRRFLPAATAPNPGPSP